MTGLLEQNRGVRERFLNARSSAGATHGGFLPGENSRFGRVSVYF
jgi:hypothetical protein